MAGYFLMACLVFTPVLIFLYRGIAPVGVADSLAGIDLRILARTLRFTVFQAMLSALLAVGISLPGAYIVGRLRFPGNRFFRALTLATFVLPSIVVVVGIIGFWGRSGVVSEIFGIRIFNLYGVQGIVLAHVFFNASFAVRIIGDSWERIGEEYREASMLDGAGSACYARRIVAPLIAPSMLSSFLLIFIFSFLSFGIVLVFGGISYSTLEVRIYQELFTYADGAGAAWYAIVQIVFSAAFIFAFSIVLPRLRSDRTLTASRRRLIRELRPRSRVFLLLYAIIFVTFVAGPLISIVPKAGIDGFRSVFINKLDGRSLADVVGRSLFEVVQTSVAVATVTAVVCFCVSYVIAKLRIGVAASTFAQLPLGISVVSFAVGLRFIAGRDVSPFMLVVAANAFFSFPVVFRILDTALSEFPSQLTDAGKISGANTRQIARYIEWPVLKRSFSSAFGYALAIPLADFTGVITIGRGRLVTFPVAIYRMLGFRNFRGAFALSFIYIGIIIILLFVFDSRVREERVRVPAREVAVNPTGRAL